MFAEVEAAIAVEPEVLETAQREMGNLFGCLDAADMPSSQVISKIRRRKNCKAPGPDQLPNELLKAGGEVLAKYLHLLLMKAAGAEREPLEWKVGLAIPLFKNGSHNDPRNNRPIFLSDANAKLSHACLRDRLSTTLEIIACPTCFGGRPGKSTNMDTICCKVLFTSRLPITSPWV